MGFSERKISREVMRLVLKRATGGVHFKGNTAVNGLPVGMESRSTGFQKHSLAMGCQHQH